VAAIALSGIGTKTAKTEAAADRVVGSSYGLPNFVALAKQLKPAVVNVSTTQAVRRVQPFHSPFGEDGPFNEFSKRFSPNPGQLRQRSLGSEVIIESDGFILTNNHVVDNAEKITVKLSNDREFAAEVVGRDPKTDITLLKINTQAPLPVARLGDSDRLEVGEWVAAIGNPFGLDNTVTEGIVCAKGRHIGDGPYEDFIQTDASINPGNSGGPLINMSGEIVGINTAIFSQTGGNIGIGFAIPINLVKEILPQLKSKGKVTRGWLGVAIQKVTPDIAESMGLDKPKGALVSQIVEGSPADRAGVKVGDLIVEYNGKEIRDANELPILVARTTPQEQVRVKVLRDKKETSFTVTIRELKEQEIVASANEKKESLGLTVQGVAPQLAESLGLDRPRGVVVTSVKPGSAGDEAGLQRSDVILEIDRKPIKGLSDYRRAIADVKQGKAILFLIRRGENTIFLALKSSE
jgi:serine protease Do